MKKLLLILLCLPMIGFGQGWVKEYILNSGCAGHTVLNTSDGGFIILGEQDFDADSIEDMFIIKTDGNGTLDWSKDFVGNDQFIGGVIKHTNDGGYIIITSKQDSASSEVFLIKIDNLGNQQWQKAHTLMGGVDNVYPSDIQQTSDGGFILNSISLSDHSVHLIKTDVNGNLLWEKIIGRLGIGSVEQTIDSGFIIPISDTIIKTNLQGDIEWKKTLSSTANFLYQIQTVRKTIDSGYIAAATKSSLTTWPPQYTPVLIKTDSNGNVDWEKNMNGEGFVVSAFQTTDGGYICNSSASSSGLGIMLDKTDANGNIIWTKSFTSFGSSSLSYGRSAPKQTSNNGYVFTGQIIDTLNTSVVLIKTYLVKTDGNGNITSTFNIPTPNSNRKLQKTVDILGRETKATNQPLFYIYDDGTVEKRMVIE